MITKLIRQAARNCSVYPTSQVIPIIVSGPSGSGKSTILKRTLNDNPESFSFVVSHTTRKPRPKEKDGIDYHFIDKAQMEQMIKEEEFLEIAEFSGNYYGTSKAEIARIKSDVKIPVLDVDLTGVLNIKRALIRGIFVFIKAPTVDDCYIRLRKRATESEEVINNRCKRAVSDLQYVEKNKHLFDLIIINDILDVAYKQFTDFVQEDIDALLKARQNR